MGQDADPLEIVYFTGFDDENLSLVYGLNYYACISNGLGRIVEIVLLNQ